MITNFFITSTKFLLSSLLFMSMGTVLAHDDDNGDENDDGKRHRVRVVDCSHPYASIQRKVDRVTRRLGDRPVTIVITGVCSEDVTIKKNDLTLVGEGGTVDGTITIRTARWVVIRNLEVTGPGAGIVGTENAAFTVEDSVIKDNDTDGIVVDKGANGTITGNTITGNGRAALPDSGNGVLVNDGGNATISHNTIENNRSNGVGVFNGAFARVEDNMIQGNGRPAVFEAGIQVTRAQVRANRNIIKNNGYAAVEVGNDGSYRTGTFLSAADNPNNIGAFEIIEGVGGDGRVAVDVFRMGLADLRQVHIKGPITVGNHSHLSVRGDNVLPGQVCSTIDTGPDGSIDLFGPFSSAAFRATNVTGPIFGGPISGSTVCPPF